MNSITGGVKFHECSEMTFTQNNIKRRRFYEMTSAKELRIEERRSEQVLRSHQIESKSLNRLSKCQVVYCCLPSAATRSISFTITTIVFTCLLLMAIAANNQLYSTIQCQGERDIVENGGVSRLKEAEVETESPNGHRMLRRLLSKRSPTPSMPASLLMPANELRVSGSKSEPPSRPSVDWSKQRPNFGTDMARNVSVELGKTAYLTCKVFDLGDKTVSWLRPAKNEILTAGKYTYIGDPRFASINDHGSHDWILEIKDVGLNDSTSYECQVSTDPKMSAIINLHVKAAKARIKQGEQFYAPSGSNIEFTCEIGLKPSVQSLTTPSVSVQQTYWYHNGNLLNYARAQSLERNFSIEWEPSTQGSRFKLFNVQLNDAGNYTCKPTSAEPATIRLHVKRFSKNGSKDRSHHTGGYPSNGGRESNRPNRQHYTADSVNAIGELDSSASTIIPISWISVMMPISLLILSLNNHR